MLMLMMMQMMVMTSTECCWEIPRGFRGDNNSIGINLNQIIRLIPLRWIGWSNFITTPALFHKIPNACQNHDVNQEKSSSSQEYQEIDRRKSLSLLMYRRNHCRRLSRSIGCRRRSWQRRIKGGRSYGRRRGWNRLLYIVLPCQRSNSLPWIQWCWRSSWRGFNSCRGTKSFFCCRVNDIHAWRRRGRESKRYLTNYSIERVKIFMIRQQVMLEVIDLLLIICFKRQGWWWWWRIRFPSHWLQLLTCLLK